MERLTDRDNGNAYYPYCFQEETCDGMGYSEKCNECKFSENACERLAAYEDLDITPEQVRELDRAYTDLCVEFGEYKKLEERLENMFGGRLPLEKVVDDLELALTEPDSPHPVNARILTHAESAEWEEYLEVKRKIEEKSGRSLDVVKLLHYFLDTVFEGEKHEGFCILTNEDAKMWNEYRAIGTVEELQALKEKSVAKKAGVSMKCHEAYCPTCKEVLTDDEFWALDMSVIHCEHCGQAVQGTDYVD